MIVCMKNLMIKNNIIIIYVERGSSPIELTVSICIDYAGYIHSLI